MILENYDKDKFIILVCAGPTARNIEFSEEYYTAGVNVTPNLIEQTDFWIVNDACYLKDFSEEKYSKIKNLALPEFPHTVNGINYAPDSDNNYISVTKHLPKDIKIHPFNIHTAKRFALPYNREFPYFDIRSTSEVSFKWLIHNGFNKFISLGHDPDGGYHKSQYSRPTRSGGHEIVKAPIDNERYKEVHQRMRSVIQNSNCTWLRVILAPGQSFNEQIFNKVKGARYDSTGYSEVMC